MWFSFFPPLSIWMLKCTQRQDDTCYELIIVHLICPWLSIDMTRLMDVWHNSKASYPNDAHVETHRTMRQRWIFAVRNVNSAGHGNETKSTTKKQMINYVCHSFYVICYQNVRLHDKNKIFRYFDSSFVWNSVIMEWNCTVTLNTEIRIKSSVNYVTEKVVCKWSVFMVNGKICCGIGIIIFWFYFLLLLPKHTNIYLKACVSSRQHGTRSKVLR